MPSQMMSKESQSECIGAARGGIMSVLRTKLWHVACSVLVRTHAQPSVSTHGQRATSCLRIPKVLMRLPLRDFPTPFSAMSFRFVSASLGHCLSFSRTAYERSVRSKPLYRHLCSLSALARDEARQIQQESCTFSGTRTSASSPCRWCVWRSRHRRSRDPRGGSRHSRWSSS